MKAFILALFTIIMTGCANFHTPNQIDAAGKSCERLLEHYSSDGTLIPTGYVCEADNPRVKNTANACSWVSGYTRKDGQYVDSHYRCKYNFSAVSNSSGASTSSSSGPVNVRGYYRKDGTYVRPHTRSRGR